MYKDENDNIVNRNSLVEFSLFGSKIRGYVNMLLPGGKIRINNLPGEIRIDAKNVLVIT